MSTAVRRARAAGAVGVSAIALMMVTACGSGTVTTSGTSSAETTTEAPTTQAPTTEAPTTEAQTTQAAGTQPATDADLEAAKQAFVDFYKATAAGDAASACALVLDPTTGAAASGAFLEQCTEGVTSIKGSYSTEVANSISTADLDGHVESDGSILIYQKGGADGDGPKIVVSKSSDGKMYIDLVGTGQRG